jgi:hypothetical protein
MSDKLGTVEGLGEHLTPPQDLLSFKQIEKLKLEIEILSKKNKKIEKFSPLFPLLATFVTLVALVIGFWQFQRQQKSLQDKTTSERQHERATQLQNQLRSDVNEILRFAQDKTQTISMVSFLLDDMKILIESASRLTDQESAQAFIGYDRKVTKALVEQIVNDADLMKSPKDVIFTNTIARNWGDYQNYLREKEQLETLDGILYKYVRALRYLREGNRSYVKEVTYDNDTQHYKLPKASEKGESEEILFQHLRRIMEGFREHLNFLSNDPRGQEIKRRRIWEFGEALCNEIIARHILGDADFVSTPCMEQ